MVLKLHKFYCTCITVPTFILVAVAHLVFCSISYLFLNDAVLDDVSNVSLSKGCRVDDFKRQVTQFMKLNVINVILQSISKADHQSFDCITKNDYC